MVERNRGIGPGDRYDSALAGLGRAEDKSTPNLACRTSDRDRSPEFTELEGFGSERPHLSSAKSGVHRRVDSSLVPQ
jgi:hypothetical protein